jgi:hypothetical protein
MIAETLTEALHPQQQLGRNPELKLFGNVHGVEVHCVAVFAVNPAALHDHHTQPSVEIDAEAHDRGKRPHA